MKQIRVMPPCAERLRALLSYDRETGLFTRRQWAGGQAPGTIANGRSGRGYVRISIDGARYFAHRLAWLYERGEWPDELDHINRNRSDNRIENLRAVSHKQNGENIVRRKPSKASGHVGVTLHQGRWRARITHCGREIEVGRFGSLAEAVSARRAAETALFTHRPRP